MGKLHVRRIDRGEIHLPTFAVALTIPGRRRGTKMDMIGSQFESDCLDLRLEAMTWRSWRSKEEDMICGRDR
jgi:hypothetical protein